MKNKTGIVTLIIALFVLILVLSTFLGFVLMGKFSFDMFQNSGKIIYDEKFDVDDFDKIKISSISGDITFKEGTTDTIEVVLYGKSTKDVEVLTSNKTLVIDYTKMNICIGFCFKNNDIIVYLPTTYTGDIEIKSTSGSVSLVSVESDNMKVTTVSGDVKIEKSNHLSVKTTSGNVKLESVENDLTIQTVSGDVRINNFEMKVNSTIKSTSGDITINGLYNTYVSTKTISGDVRINNNDRKSDLELKITTVSGDIKVN